MLPLSGWLVNRLRDAGLTSGSTRAKRTRGEDEDRGLGTLGDTSRSSARRSGREAGRPEAEADT